ncbi:hypothetical protein [Micromonospora sp. LOL_023]|uniref:hypothetical protein n=1 Tax=Micromonospora sp. LOL_023 TaxID=3345418 RepID=UPI003A871A23
MSIGTESSRAQSCLMSAAVLSSRPDPGSQVLVGGGHTHAGRLTIEHQVRPLHEVFAAWQAQADGSASARIVITP